MPRTKSDKGRASAEVLDLANRRLRIVGMPPVKVPDTITMDALYALVRKARAAAGLFDLTEEGAPIVVREDEEDERPNEHSAQDRG